MFNCAPAFILSRGEISITMQRAGICLCCNIFIILMCLVYAYKVSYWTLNWLKNVRFRLGNIVSLICLKSAVLGNFLSKKVDRHSLPPLKLQTSTFLLVNVLMLESMMFQTSNLHKPRDKPYINNALVCTRKSVLILYLLLMFWQSVTYLLQSDFLTLNAKYVHVC